VASGQVRRGGSEEQHATEGERERRPRRGEALARVKVAAVQLWRSLGVDIWGWSHRYIPVDAQRKRDPSHRLDR
jgi:hypothetical protein